MNFHYASDFNCKRHLMTVSLNFEACPLGSYCPLATLNNSTGTCEPYVKFPVLFSLCFPVYDVCDKIILELCRYAYQLPAAIPDHTCGGAEIWTDVGTSSDVFCSAGYYCPTTTNRTPCSSGY